MPFHCRSRFAGIFLLCGCIIWLALAPGQEAAAPPKAATEFYFHHDHVIGTSLDLWMICADEATALQAERAILDEIERLRRVFSTFDSDSEISGLNRMDGASAKPQAASREMIEVLRQYEIWQRRSHGAFSGQLGELVRVWKDAEKNQMEPDAATLSALVHQIGQPGWSIDEAHQTVKRLTSQPLNLNSIAKGYIIGKAAASARSQTPSLQGWLLNLGGDMAVWGKEWAIGVQDPFHPEDNAAPVAVVRLRHGAIATSGGYQRFYTINGQRHSHIFDPRTGRSAAGASSATVIAADNVTANALATTLCVLTPEEGLNLVAATPGVDCLLITKDGRQLRSPGFPAMEIAVTADVALIQDKKEEDKKPPEKKPEEKKTDPWPEGYQVNVALTIPQISSNRYRRPYVALWVEDADAKAVRTITVWGTNPRYWPTLPQWWKIGRNDNKLVKAVTRATRAPGTYQLVWDGRDDKGATVAQGTYTVHLEVHREHGKLVPQTGKITCNADPAQITLEKNAETGDTIVDYAKKKAP